MVKRKCFWTPINYPKMVRLPFHRRLIARTDKFSLTPLAKKVPIGTLWKSVNSCFKNWRVFDVFATHFQFKKVPSGEDLPDILERLRYTSIAWTHDKKGVFYNVNRVQNFSKIIFWLTLLSEISPKQKWGSRNQHG